jgi:Flp pilus assembly protein TadG
MKSIRSFEKGQALVVIALAAVALFGFVALAIDGTAKFADRRNAQNASDTAALAAALAKVNAITDGDSNTPLACTSEDMSTASEVCVALVLAGLDRADSNGYDTANSTIQVYSPPLNGYYATVANSDDYVQVIITSHVPTTFMRVFGVNQSDNIVSAVAYMKEGKDLTDGAMIISYDPDPNCSTGGEGGYSVQVSGSSEVNLYGGGILLNSDEVCGFKIPNCADLNMYDGGTINTVGADNVNLEGCTFDPEITPNYDQDPIAIPEDVYWPDVPPACGITPSTPTQLGEITVGDPPKVVEEWLIYPGYYENFPSEALDVKGAYVYLASGVYCVNPPMDQDLTWRSVDAALINGSTDPLKNKYQDPDNPLPDVNPDGVTIYIKAGGGFSINAKSPTYLDASTDGDYQGYLVILEGTHTSHPSCTINGGADINLNGLIFAPYCNFVINGKAGEDAEINAQLIGWDIKINGDNTINFNYDPSNKVILKRRLGLMK